MRDDTTSRYRADITIEIKAGDEQEAKQLARHLVLSSLKGKKHPTIPRTVIIGADLIDVRPI